MRERLKLERRGLADHCRVDATGDRVHALRETHAETGLCRISSSGAVYVKPNGRVRHRRELRQPADMMHYATGQTGRVPGTSGQKVRSAETGD